jgi:hypothetical protein
MKALALLDHVMLWMARGFAVTFALFLTYWSWEICTDTDLQMVYEITHNPHDYIAFAFIAAYRGIWAFVWLICVWHSPTVITRSILGLSSGILAFWLIKIIALGDSPIHSAIVLGMRPTFDLLAMPVLFILGIAAMAWLAVRGLNSRPTNSASSIEFNNPDTRHALS